jgi:type VI secretion system secreted protein VgrG
MVELENRRIRLISPPGKDVLFFFRMVATERLGHMFEMGIECLSNDHHIKLQDVLGKTMTIELDLETDSSKIRYFNGFVTAFSYLGHFEGFGHYKATLRPWLWFLSRKQDSRIFQGMTVPEILQEIFKDINGFTDFERKLTKTYRTWEYCVQYRETDFNFVSRLMEQEGIYYYFKHEKNKHILVLSDDYSSHGSYPNYANLKYFHPEETYRRQEDHIWQWNILEEVQSGQVVLDDFNFIKPSAELKATSAFSGKNHPHAKIEVFDYPGIYTETKDGDNYARVRMEEHNAQYEKLRGEGNARGLSVGHLFKLEAPQAPNWRKEQNREYLITTAKHILLLEGESSEEGSEEGLEEGLEDSYACQFEAMDAKIPFRPPRVTPKPTVPGPQTAIVCGKSGEEIWTDKYGRIKVQFHWDRQGKKDENSSCWIRVAQIWAGKKWGGMFIPRIGQEVVVDFLEGDPDRPLITGRVYNDELMPPYDLPAEMTKSTIKSESTKNGSPENFNELRFEDKKGEEEVYFHAEKDFNRVVENNDTLKVGFEDKDKGDQTREINHDRTTTIGNNDTLKVGYDGDKQDGSQTVKIYKDRTTTLETGNDTLTITQGNQKTKISAGKSLHDAAQEIQLKVGGSKIVIKPAEITIEAPQITVKATATLKLESPKSELKGTGILTLQGGVIKIN